jgi:hypothetical protein
MADIAETLQSGDLMGALGINSGGMAGVGKIVLIIGISVVVMIMIGVIFYFRHKKKQFKYTIPLFARIGNVPTRVGTYKARDIPIGKAGDKLWFVAGLNKYIQVANIQTAKNEFWHWVREDGELINFSLEDLDEVSHKAGVKYIHQDMRMQRLATDKLLEQRFLQKSFWEKWGAIIGYVIFFLLITISIVIVFYMMNKTVDKINLLMDRLLEAMRIYAPSGGSSLVPAS